MLSLYAQFTTSCVHMDTTTNPIDNPNGGVISPRSDRKYHSAKNH